MSANNDDRLDCDMCASHANLNTKMGGEAKKVMT